MVVLTSVRTSHSLITYIFLLNKQRAPICDKSQLPLSIVHILIDYPKYKIRRFLYFSGTTTPSKTIPREMFKFPLITEIINRTGLSSYFCIQPFSYRPLSHSNLLSRRINSFHNIFMQPNNTFQHIQRYVDFITNNFLYISLMYVYKKRYTFLHLLLLSQSLTFFYTNPSTPQRIPNQQSYFSIIIPPPSHSSYPSKTNRFIRKT